MQVAVAAGKGRRKTRRQRAATLHLQYLSTGPGADEKQQTAAATTTAEEVVRVEAGAVLLWTLQKAAGRTGRITTSRW